eukprot:gene23570-9094_t
MQRADSVEVLRRVPMEGYDISFLFTDSHVLQFGRMQLADFVCTFVQQIYVEVEGLKSDVKASGRAAAVEFLRGLAF